MKLIILVALTLVAITISATANNTTTTEERPAFIATLEGQKIAIEKAESKLKLQEGETWTRGSAYEGCGFAEIANTKGEKRYVDINLFVKANKIAPDKEDKPG